MLVIDTAHGHSKKVLNILSKVKRISSRKSICVGNIASGEAARELYNEGADILKVGIGPGSICTTRLVAGIGVPQLSAIMSVKKELKNKNIRLYLMEVLNFPEYNQNSLLVQILMMGSYLLEQKKVMEKNII